MAGLTNWFSTIDSVQHLGFVDGRGHVLDLNIRQGDDSWGVYDVTDETGPPYEFVQELWVVPGEPPWRLRNAWRPS